MLSALTYPASGRGKFVVLLAWLLVVGVMGQLAGRFEGAQKNEPSSFLPGNAESVKVLERSKRFPSGQVTPAVVVYRRAGGLTAADRRLIARDRRDLNADPPVATLPVGPAVPSRDRTAALLSVPVRAGGEESKLTGAVDDIRGRVDRPGGGLQVEVTGPAGFSADAVKVFGSINGTLLVATVSLVFVLLILIYRSPVFWVIPLLSVGFAEIVARGLGYLIASSGVTVNGQSGGILPVLVFGAGTDYALLLVARYREELRRHESKQEAMAIALRRAGPAIVASGLTVIAALLCLTLAQVNGTRGLGPIGAMGIGVAMVSSLTLLPALLVLAGRRAFWPFVPRNGDSGTDVTHGVWRRVGDRVARAPRRVWIGTVAVLGIMAVGLAYYDTDLTSGNGFRNDVEAVQGQDLISESFPAGATGPATAIVGDAARTASVRRALARADGVGGLGPVERGAPGARFSVTLDAAPYSDAAFKAIPSLRSAAKQAGGDTTIVGGPTAEERDLRVAAARDNRVIVPITLMVVFTILGALLRSLVAPLLLTATVVLSFGAALGVSYFFFEEVFGFPGSDPSLPLFGFVFLIALGVDYNVFLMTRVREEAQRRGTREGMLRGLAVTGAVITAAGIVLAGTFSTLAVLPLVALTQIGFVVAFGVLLDTFVVRSILVPALTLDLGKRIWWPSALARGPDGGPEPALTAGRP